MMNKNWVITGALVAAVVFLTLVVIMQGMELQAYSAFQIGLFK
jgi:CHASE2 domain-containing sensor protein